MGEEVRMMSDYEGGGSGGDGDDERVSDWEAGLPTADDLTPLSQTLIPAELASAFSISPEPCRTAVDVNRASQKTVSTLRGAHSQAYSSKYKSFDDNGNGNGNNRSDEPMVVEVDDAEEEEEGSDSRKSRKVDSPEEADSALRIENTGGGGGGDDQLGRAVKRPRLVWTPQLHKRFVDVVAHLGIKNAVPKTIMQLMNVEGLTRENVASHLQKYRLYLKRMQGLSNDGPSSSDPLFASTPVPQSLRQQQHHESSSGSAHHHGHGHGNGHMPISIPMPYPAGAMMAMPSYMGMPGGYHGFESHSSYNMMQQQNYGGMVSYPPHVSPNEK